MSRLRAYYAESWARWFVLRCRFKCTARREAIEEFGREFVKDVRLATPDEVLAYRRQLGDIEETIDE